ncbi:MAG TPA: elongation factor P [Alphaproteobacteria bacterium]|nr:elongation factor P [Alphaproteobacteria bacterium]
MKVQANTVRPGQVLEHNGKLWTVTNTQIVQPGKGGAFIQVEMKEVKAGTKTVERYRTQETVERARLDEYECTFLFAEGDNLTFMNKENYEQIVLPRDVVGDAAVFLQDGMEVTVLMHENSPLSCDIPQQVTVTITETEPTVKGQTAASSYKPAMTDIGVRVLVPPFVGTGERIVVATADSTYVERAK